MIPNVVAAIIGATSEDLAQVVDSITSHESQVAELEQTIKALRAVKTIIEVRLGINSQTEKLTPVEAHGPTCGQKIIDLVTAQGGMTVKQICDQLGITRYQVHGAVTRSLDLRRDGDLVVLSGLVKNERTENTDADDSDSEDVDEVLLETPPSKKVDVSVSCPQLPVPAARLWQQIQEGGPQTVQTLAKCLGEEPQTVREMISAHKCFRMRGAAVFIEPQDAPEKPDLSKSIPKEFSITNMTAFVEAKGGKTDADVIAKHFNSYRSVVVSRVLSSKALRLEGSNVVLIRT